MSCSYNGRSFSNGSLICANGREMKCDSGNWRETGYRCNTRTAGKQLATLTIDQALLDSNATLEQQKALGLLLLNALRKASELESKAAAGTAVPFSDTDSGSGNDSGSSGGSGDGGSWNVSTNDRGGVDANVSIDIGPATIDVGVSTDNSGNTDTNIGIGGSWSW